MKAKTQSRTRRTYAVAFSPDGETLAIRYPGGLQNESKDIRLELWDVKTGKLRDSLPDDWRTRGTDDEKTRNVA